MAQLIVRKLEAKLVGRLKRRAKEHGISMEEEHRRILKEILEIEPKKRQPAKSFLDLVCEAPDFGNPDLLRKKDRPRRSTFD